MTAKEIILETVQQLPADVTFEEVLDELATLVAIERAQAAAIAGETTPHEEFQQRAMLWPSK